MREKEARRRAFVLRLWLDENGRIYGHIQEPMSGWQRPFTGIETLPQLIVERLTTHSESTDVKDAGQ
jgi:hypothetical protein